MPILGEEKAQACVNACLRQLGRYNRLMRNNLCVLLLVLTLALTLNGSAQTHKRATPPTADQVVGAWIGFDGGGSEFIRLELQADGSGYLAVVAPANFTTHDYGVQVYRVARWSISGWQIRCDMSPISSNAEPAQANGEFSVSSVRLTIHGVKRQWKIESALYMESRLDGSNKETKEAILAAQNK
jgi:hypothetical protein